MTERINLINIMRCCIKLRRVSNKLNGIDTLLEYLTKKVNGKPYEDEFLEYWEGFIEVTLEDFHQNMLEENMTLEELTQMVIKYKVLETINLSKSSVGIIDQLFDDNFGKSRTPQSYLNSFDGYDSKEDVEQIEIDDELEEQYDDKDFYDTNEAWKGKKAKDISLIDQIF